MTDIPIDITAELAELRSKQAANEEKIASLESRQLADEEKFKKLATYSRHQTIVLGLLVGAIGGSFLGVSFADEYRDAFKGVVGLAVAGAFAAPFAKES
jgi:hypothetical protein